MKSIGIAIVTLTTAWTAFAADNEVTGKSYRFTIPDKVTFKPNPQMEFYTFTWGDALFMLNVNPVSISAEALKPMAKMMETTFMGEMTKQIPGSEIDLKKSNCELGPFKGTEMKFTIKDASGNTSLQYMMLLHDGENAWNAQLTANSAEALAVAHGILQKAKKLEPAAVAK